jgi:hypothetical protein
LGNCNFRKDERLEEKQFGNPTPYIFQPPSFIGLKLNAVHMHYMFFFFEMFTKES